MSVNINHLIASLDRDSREIYKLCMLCSQDKTDMKDINYLETLIELFKNKIEVIQDQCKMLRREELGILDEIKKHIDTKINILNRKERGFLSAEIGEKLFLARIILLLDELSKEITNIIDHFTAKSSPVVTQHIPKIPEWQQRSSTISMDPAIRPEQHTKLPKLQRNISKVDKRQSTVGANKNMDPVLKESFFPPVDDRLPPLEPHPPVVPRDPRGRKKK